MAIDCETIASRQKPNPKGKKIKNKENRHRHFLELIDETIFSHSPNEMHAKCNAFKTGDHIDIILSYIV